MFDFVYFSLTDKCNLNCRFCYVSYNEQNGENELSLQEIERFLEQFASSGGKGIQFTGGEIFTRDDIENILTSALNHGLYVSIITNGTLLSESNVSFLKDKHIDITLSIDGPREVHDTSRGCDGAYDKVIKSLELLKRNNIRFSLQCMLFPKSLQKQVSWLEEFSRVYMPRSIRLADVCPEGRAKLNTDLMWDQAQFSVIKDIAKQLARKINYHVLFLTNIISRPELEYFYPNFSDVVKPWIMPDGSMYPFLTYNNQWRMGSVTQFPNYDSKVLADFKNVCESAYNKALEMEYFSPFKLLAETANEE